MVQVLGVGLTAGDAEVKAAYHAKRWMQPCRAHAAYRQIKREAGRRAVDREWLNEQIICQYFQDLMESRRAEEEAGAGMGDVTEGL